VLLGVSDVVKVADFGTVREGAKTGEHGTVNTHALTRAIVGTKVSHAPPLVTPDPSCVKLHRSPALLHHKGYMPPEYEKSGHVSEKTDSYAFAIVLVELLTGRVGLAAAALQLEEPDLFADMHQFVDAQAGAWPPAVVAGLAAVAERCICTHARNRATVRDVVPLLDDILPAAPSSFGVRETAAESNSASASAPTATSSASGTDID
jgi:serine/threonine protein kinase